jgi:hypothetical protein
MIDLINNHSETLVQLCQRYNVKHLELFGSALDKDKFNPQTSDIDFLVEFSPMLPAEHAECYFGLLDRLQDIFGRNVDLVEVNAIRNPYLRESINKTRTEIYAA